MEYHSENGHTLEFQSQIQKLVKNIINNWSFLLFLTINNYHNNRVIFYSEATEGLKILRSYKGLQKLRKQKKMVYHFYGREL